MFLSSSDDLSNLLKKMVILSAKFWELHVKTVKGKV